MRRHIFVISLVLSCNSNIESSQPPELPEGSKETNQGEQVTEEEITSETSKDDQNVVENPQDETMSTPWPKLTMQSCTDPDLSEIPSGVQLTMCDGTMGEGTMIAPDLSNLVAENVKSGVEIGGITGSYDNAGVSYDDCTSDGEQDCVVRGDFRATDTTSMAAKIKIGESVAGVAGTYSPDFPDANQVLATDTVNGISGTFIPPSDCSSDGQINCLAVAAYPAAETAGLPDKVLSTASVAGISGNVVLPSAGDVLAGSGSYGAGGTAVTPTLTLPLVSNVLSGTGTYGNPGAPLTPALANLGSWDLETAFPGAGYFSGTSNAPTAAEICNTKTLLGSAGTANCAGGNYQSLMRSGIYRDKGGSPAQMTLNDELAAGDLATLYAAGYREIPLISKDDDSHNGTSIDKVTRDPMPSDWDTGAGTVDRKACGMGIATIAGRVTDCDTQHTTKPPWDAVGADGKISWDGETNGNNSEGSWTLVTVYMRGSSNGTVCDSTCREVWRDDRTGLLWSDQIGDLSTTNDQGKFNWCKSTGSNNETGNPYKEADPSGYCDSASHQSQTDPMSLCAEDAVHLLTPTGITDATTYEFDDPKGGMRATANYDGEGSGNSPSIYWRVPTPHDWSLAELNGVRHVLPNMARIFWSASVLADARGYGWTFYGDNGTVSLDYRDSHNHVRCVGR